MRVAIRVDASSSIGSGHVFRCLNLATALRERGADVFFVCREHPGNLCAEIASRGFEVLRLSGSSASVETDGPPHARWLGASWEQDAAQTRAALEPKSPPVDWIIADHYALDARWERAVRACTRRIM